LAIANGIVLPICDPTVSSCTFDFTIQADVNATHLVADVMGYFAAPVRTPLDITVVENSVSVAAGSNGLVTAACAVDQSMSGGGCIFGSFASPLVFIGSGPTASGWTCAVRNPSLSADTLRVNALCGRTPGR